MNCFNHPQTAAVGICAVCQKAICRACVGVDVPRVVCRDCAVRGGVLYGFEYRSAIAVGSWPLLHICGGIDPVTLRPRVAKGVIAIGNIAVGVVALGGLSCGLAAIGGLSVGLLLAVGGGAVGAGYSLGGLAVGTVAIGGVAIGFKVALGGLAIGPSIVDARRCDPAALDYLRGWLGSGSLPRNCQ